MDFKKQSSTFNEIESRYKILRSYTNKKFKIINMAKFHMLINKLSQNYLMNCKNFEDS